MSSYFLMQAPVRKYVEGTRDAAQFLDLLAAGGSEEIEPTRATGARSILYAEVGRELIFTQVD